MQVSESGNSFKLFSASSISSDINAWKQKFSHVLIEIDKLKMWKRKAEEWFGGFDAYTF